MHDRWAHSQSCSPKNVVLVYIRYRKKSCRKTTTRKLPRDSNVTILNIFLAAEQMALNCWNPGIVKTFLIVAAVATVAQGQSEYENCTTNYSVLEKALLKTNNNLYRLTTTFYPPNKDNPLYVSVTYKFLNTSDSTVLNTTDYRWASASLYLTIHPHTISYLSLLFCYVENDRIADLELELPGECENLTQNLHSNASDFLFVITHRVILYSYIIFIPHC